MKDDRNHSVARRTLRAIALFEALKGIAAFAVMIGMLDLMHSDVQHLAIELIGHFGMAPGGHYSTLLLRYADLLPKADFQTLFLLAIIYILVRLTEAYGLWNDLAWGEWIGALSGGIYIPFEAGHFVQHPSLISGIVLAGNVFIVCFLGVQLWNRRKHAS